MTAISIGTHVRIPGHGVAGIVATFTGDARERLVSVELADGTIMPVREADVVINDDPPPADPPAPQPGQAIDVIVFARDLARRTQNLTSDESRALNQLARAYLVAMGRRL